MELKRKMLSVATAAAVAVGALIVGVPNVKNEEFVSAASTETSGTCGENLTWELDDEGTLTISGSGEMKNYNSGQAPWYNNRDNITRIVVEKDTTSIGDYAFSYLYNIYSISLPDTVETIGIGSFIECSSMTHIEMPNSIESVCDEAFYSCTSLKSVTLPKNKSLIIGKNIFEKCTHLKDITIPDGITKIPEEAFKSCDSLVDIVIPQSVNSIDECAFYSCYGLQRVTIKNKNCDIKAPFCFTNTISEFWGTIYGYEGSTAEGYANKWKCNFEALDEDPDSTEAVSGDANGDDVLNIRDAAYIAKKVAQGKVSELPMSADFNGDGTVNIRDAAAIAKYLVKK